MPQSLDKLHSMQKAEGEQACQQSDAAPRRAADLYLRALSQRRYLVIQHIRAAMRVRVTGAHRGRALAPAVPGSGRACAPGRQLYILRGPVGLWLPEGAAIVGACKRSHRVVPRQLRGVRGAREQSEPDAPANDSVSPCIGSLFSCALVAGEYAGVPATR